MIIQSFADFPSVFQMLTPPLLSKVIEEGLEKGGEFVEVYLESRFAQSVLLEEGLIKETSEHQKLGAGVRVISSGITGFAYTNTLDEASLKDAVRTAAAVAKGGKAGQVSLEQRFPPGDVYFRDRPGYLTDLEEKLKLVRRAEASAQNYDHRIDKVQVSLTDSMQWMLVANSEGILTGDTRPQMRLSVTAMAQDRDQRHSGHGSGGGRVGLAYFDADHTPEAIGREAAEEAVTLLDARDAKPGMQTVVLGPKHSGVMIHEAVGHPLEADGHWKKTAVLTPYWQQMVASPLVTILDDPTLPGMRGSLNVDDEGVPAEKVVLIDKGRFTGRIYDRLSAQKLGASSNGHGRRDGYSSMPVPRMTNTYLASGSDDEESIIKSVKKGFYAHSYQGGMVQNSGKFTFSINLGWLIEDGKLTAPIKNATLIGHNLEILKKIDRVGNTPGWFLGTCGKDGQSAAVTAGTPALRISSMTVGGQDHA